MIDTALPFKGILIPLHDYSCYLQFPDLQEVFTSPMSIQGWTPPTPSLTKIRQPHGQFPRQLYLPFTFCTLWCGLCGKTEKRGALYTISGDGPGTGSLNRSSMTWLLLTRRRQNARHWQPWFSLSSLVIQEYSGFSARNHYLLVSSP